LVFDVLFSKQCFGRSGGGLQGRTNTPASAGDQAIRPPIAYKTKRLNQFDSFKNFLNVVRWSKCSAQT